MAGKITLTGVRTVNHYFYPKQAGISTVSLVGVKYTEAGVAATIMSTSPILIIPPAVVFFKEKVGLRAVAGAFVAMGGVAVLFL